MRLCTLCKKLFSDDRTLCPDHTSVPSSTQIVSIEPLPVELAARFPQHEPFALGNTGTLYRLGASQVLLKVLHASFTSTRDASERARYRRELRRQQNLIHPQLPRVHEVGETADRIWFTRDFIDGESLAVRLREGHAFELPATYSIIIQLAAALDALHQLGLVHRDLKPGHVLLRANRSPRESLQLIDATLAGPLTPHDALRHGTPEYAAKELVEGAPATFRSDLYALGCLSYELLSGAPPFRDATANAAGALATLTAQRESEADELPDSVPEAVRSLITSMLAKDAHRRPFSAQQVRRALEPHVAPAHTAARTASLSDTPPAAAALRFSGPAAKPVTPATFPDATVELDVEDLDDAIQVNDEPSAGAAPVAGQPQHAAGSSTADAESSGPTIALNTQNTRAIMSSMLPSASKPGAAADVAKIGSESTSHAPTHAPTGTKFGLGPVRAQDIEAATALAAELKSTPLTAAGTSAAKSGEQETAASDLKTAAPAAAAPQPSAAKPSVRPKRYSTAPKPLLQDPRLLLVAAAGLAALIALLRVLLGPSETSRSAAVIVQVPEATQATAEELKQLEQQSQLQLEELSEAALIGGNIPRPAQLTAAQRRHAARANQADQLVPGEHSQPSAAATAPVTPAQVEELVDDRADAKDVPTVNAGSVRGGLARAAFNRQAAGSTNVSAVNANNSPDTDYKAKGRALFKAGKYTEAVEAYQRATRRDSSDASAFAGLGGSLLAKGETRRAITAYQRAVQLQPDVSGFQAALGRAYLQLGDRPRARAAYSKALKLDPNNQAARNGLANANANAKAP